MLATGRTALDCAAHSPTPLLHSAFCTLRSALCAAAAAPTPAPHLHTGSFLFGQTQTSHFAPALSLLARWLALLSFLSPTTTTLLHKVIRLDLHFACPRVPRLIVTRAFLVSRVVPVLLFAPVQALRWRRSTAPKLIEARWMSEGTPQNET
jgi:hypothetical protein